MDMLIFFIVIDDLRILIRLMFKNLNKVFCKILF